MTSRPPRPKTTIEDFRQDRLYPRIARAVADILATGKVVAPIEVFVRMDLLRREHLDDWYHGRVPYLERVIQTNLTRASRILRILRMHAHELNLKPSFTACMRHGKGPRMRPRFTKTGDSGLEEAYATHLVWPGKGPFHPPEPRQSSV